MVVERDDLEQAKARELYELSREIFGNPIARKLAESAETKHRAKELDRHLAVHSYSKEVARAIRALALLSIDHEQTFRDFSSGLKISAATMADYGKPPNFADILLQQSWIMGRDVVDTTNWPFLLKGIALPDPQGEVDYIPLLEQNQQIRFVSGKSYRDYLPNICQASIVIGQDRKIIIEREPIYDERMAPVDGLAIRYLGIVGAHHVDNFPRFFHVTKVERTRAESDGSPKPQEILLLVVPCDKGAMGFMVYQRILNYNHGNWRSAEDFTVSIEAGFELMLQNNRWQIHPRRFTGNSYIGLPIDLPTVAISYHQGSHWTGDEARTYPTFTEEAAEQLLRLAFLRLIDAKRSAENDDRLLGDYLFTHPEVDLLDLLAPPA